ncbi:platelet-activating factor acetylhydrolase (macronuclear) [Tetrahymena thermophila SB210]|uniref:1-alkyl-2-acetylglycerophosphocholine esterase n=1 Tax=Tetrahymena thermophila (strain SB210) TaxID=312017 RepID=I7M0R5_TETTS|nr:platelet-activating factor acetylhydrolase [Tetrahymena thermophila SB210]EAR90798.1 platelet-activating factor acetylhydrolase [Tetrahymena thermophila SB210]|eukprot:XP_001011043.1 platelet-activating factor acetylhydrolase [Tetrahymena thermophila SB210]
MEKLKVQKQFRRKVYPFEFLISMFLVVNTLRDLYLVQKLGNEQVESSLMDSNNIRTLIIWFILFGLKIKQEGTQISLVFSLLASANLALLKVYQYQSKILVFTEVLFLILHMLIVIKLPVYQIPDPQGQNKVGIKQMRIQDEFKTEVSVYYPCLDKNQKHRYTKWSHGKEYWRSMYESMKFGNVIIPKFFFSFFMNYVDKILINCFPNAEIIKQDSYRVIIFSHGLAAHRQSYTCFLNDLASKGYIIFSLEHYEQICPFEIMQAIKTGDDTQAKKIRGSQLNHRQMQVENLLKVVSNKDMMAKLFEQEVNLDTNNIVLMGHSFGGVTAVQAGMENKKFKAIIGLDPWLYPQKDSVLTKKYNNPILIINTETFAEKNSYYRLNEKCQEIYDSSGDKKDNKLIGKYIGTDHITQGDICFIIPTESKLLNMVRNNNNLLEVTQGQRFLISEFLEKMVFSSPSNQKQAKQEILESHNKFTLQYFNKEGNYKIQFE